MPAPGGGFTYGGTSISVYKDSKAKEAAWAYINFCYMSTKGMEINYKKLGNLPGNKSFYKEHMDCLNQGTSLDKYFAGQNTNKYFYEKIVPGVKGERQSKYTSLVTWAFTSLYPVWNKEKSVTWQQALNQMKKNIQQQAHQVTIK